MQPEALLARVFGVAPHAIMDTTSNKTLPQWDSLAHMTLIVELEAAYGVSFSAEEALAMTDVTTIKRLLGSRGVTW